MAKTDPRTIAVAHIFRQVGAELKALGDSLEAVEHNIQRIMAASGRPEPQAIRELQAIDMLNQYLAALSRFAGDIAGDMRPEWQVAAGTAFKNLPLHALAERLGGPQDGEGLGRARIDPEVEFF